MDLPASRLALSYAEYLVHEQNEGTKHEFLDGETWAMSGGTVAHVRLSGNAHVHLSGVLSEPCEAFNPDMKVRVEATGLATYPDLSVVCGELQTHPDDPSAITNPILLLEVLSPSTESYDRGEKFAHYRRIPSLRHYVLVSQDKMRIEHFHLRDGVWTFHEVEQGAVDLPELGVDLPIDAVYSRWQPPEAPA